MKRLLIEQDDEKKHISLHKEGKFDSEDIVALLLFVMERTLIKEKRFDELSAWDKIVEISKDGREAVAMMVGRENKSLN